MKITILGAGAYSIALATNLVEKNDVTLWTKFENEYNEIMNRSSHLFPNVLLDEKINVTTDISTIKNSDLIIICVPISVYRIVLTEAIPYIDNQIVLNATKGIENDTCMFPMDIANELKISNYSTLAGPSFAIDLINKCNVGLTIGSNNNLNINFSDNIQLDKTNDIKAIEICSSIKNVIAICFGILNALNISESAIATFLTLAIKDINKLLNSLNCNNEIIFKYAGIGDLYLTCSSPKSRNYTLGLKLINDRDNLNDYINNNTIEGLYTLKSIYDLTNKNNIDIPLFTIVYNIIFKNDNPNSILKYFEVSI